VTAKYQRRACSVLRMSDKLEYSLGLINSSWHILANMYESLFQLLRSKSQAQFPSTFGYDNLFFLFFDLFDVILRDLARSFRVEYDVLYFFIDIIAAYLKF